MEHGRSRRRSRSRSSSSNNSSSSLSRIHTRCVRSDAESTVPTPKSGTGLVLVCQGSRALFSCARASSFLQPWPGREHVVKVQVSSNGDQSIVYAGSVADTPVLLVPGAHASAANYWPGVPRVALAACVQPASPGTPGVEYHHPQSRRRSDVLDHVDRDLSSRSSPSRRSSSRSSGRERSTLLPTRTVRLALPQRYACKFPASFAYLGYPVFLEAATLPTACRADAVGFANAGHGARCVLRALRAVLDTVASSPVHLLPDRQEFLGRRYELSLLDQLPRMPASGMVVAGGPGSGKTSLALEYAHRSSARFRVVVWFGPEHVDQPAPADSLASDLVGDHPPVAAAAAAAATEAAAAGTGNGAANGAGVGPGHLGIGAGDVAADLDEDLVVGQGGNEADIVALAFATTAIMPVPRCEPLAAPTVQTSRRLAARLGIDPRGLDPPEVVEACLDALALCSSILMVFDINSSPLRVPSRTMRHILARAFRMSRCVVLRTSSCSGNLSSARVQLGPMSSKDAALILRRFLPAEAVTKEVLLSVGSLPVGLAQLGRAGQRLGLRTADHVLRLVQQHPVRMLDNRVDAPCADLPGALPALSSVARSLSCVVPVDLVWYAMRYISWCSPSAPISVWRQIVPFAGASTPDVVAMLLAHGVVTQDPGSDDLIHVHVLVAMAVTRLMDCLSIHQAIAWLGTAIQPFDYPDASTWDIARFLLPHVQSMLDHCQRLHVATPWVESLLWQLCNFYDFVLGKYQVALLYLHRQIDVVALMYGRRSWQYGVALNNCAIVYTKLGEHDRAVEQMRESLAIEQDHTTTSYAIRLKNLADVLVGMQQYAEAERTYNRARAIIAADIGPETSTYTVTLNNQALCYDKWGKVDKAVELYEEAIAIRERQDLPADNELATSQMNLATLVEKQGDIKRALKLYRASISLRLKILGPDHPHYARAAYWYGRCLHHNGNPGKGHKLVAHSQVVFSRELGPKHEWTRQANEWLAEHAAPS